MSENRHASEIDRLIHSSKDVIAAARRPDGLDPAVPLSSAVKVTEGRTGATSNNASFPGPPMGSWPIAVTPGSHGTMDDGTVTDGDADWSVPKR